MHLESFGDMNKVVQQEFHTTPHHHEQLCSSQIEGSEKI